MLKPFFGFVSGGINDGAGAESMMWESDGG